MGLVSLFLSRTSATSCFFLNTSAAAAYCSSVGRTPATEHQRVKEKRVCNSSTLCSLLPSQPVLRTHARLRQDAAGVRAYHAAGHTNMALLHSRLVFDMG